MRHVGEIVILESCRPMKIETLSTCGNPQEMHFGVSLWYAGKYGGWQSGHDADLTLTEYNEARAKGRVYNDLPREVLDTLSQGDRSQDEILSEAHGHVKSHLHVIADVADSLPVDDTSEPAWMNPAPEYLNDPAQPLPSVILDATLKDPTLLTFEAERSGDVSFDYMMTICAAAVCHKKDYVREGALYGLARYIDDIDVCAMVTHVKETDKSETIREIAREILDEPWQ